MESLVFALSAVVPIMAMVALGYILKRIGILPRELVKPLNKLSFKVTLPAMLFLNVYNIENAADVDYGYIFYTVLFTFAIFLIAFPLVCVFTKKNEHRGALVQAAFRSNYALIGIPLAESLFGVSGVAVATLLSAIIVPLYNVLAVIDLSIFNKNGQKANLRSVLLGVLKNPLNQSIFLGVVMLLGRGLFQQCGIEFRLSDITPLMKVLGYLRQMATPLALIILGVQFEFSVISELRKEIVFGTLARTIVVPMLALGTALLLFKDAFTGAHFAAIVAAFATPVAVSSVPMAQEMGSGSDLAGQLVVWTTLVSGFTVFLASFILKSIGVF